MEFCKATLTLTFESADETSDMNIQMKALQQYFHAVLFVFQNFTMKFGNLVEI